MLPAPVTSGWRRTALRGPLRGVKAETTGSELSNRSRLVIVEDQKGLAEAARKLVSSNTVRDLQQTDEPQKSKNIKWMKRKLERSKKLNQ